MIITRSVFLVFYLILGILFLSVRKLPFEMAPSLKTAFGIILIVYACVRLWRVITDLRN